jgi:hypothetical protein
MQETFERVTERVSRNLRGGFFIVRLAFIKPQHGNFKVSNLLGYVDHVEDLRPFGS